MCNNYDKDLGTRRIDGGSGAGPDLDYVGEAGALEGVEALVQTVGQPPAQQLHLLHVPFLNEIKWN